MIMLIIGVIVGIVAAITITRSITKPIKTIVDLLAAGADQTASVSGQISATSQSLAEGASEQAASLEEMSSMTKRNAETANRVKELGSEARQAGDTGVRDMAKMTAADQSRTGSSQGSPAMWDTLELLPWLGAVFFPGFARAEKVQVGWLDAFHVCFGWTVLLARNCRERGTFHRRRSSWKCRRGRICRAKKMRGPVDAGLLGGGQKPGA